MHTRETEHEPRGLGAAAKYVAEHASALVRLELELAALEIKRKIGSFAKGIALALTAAILLAFALGFGLATAAAAIGTATSTWVALLIVTGGLALVAGLLGALGLHAIRKATPPLPEQALREARLTTEALKHDGHV